MKRILSVFGTRPEVIKNAPLVHELAADVRFEVKICVTAQHREMLDQVLELFEITPVLKEFKPDDVLVHGDSATTFTATLADGCSYA
jgi:UDP-N-acetylglucosamine 2-epimerase (non-hydrolysing)